MNYTTEDISMRGHATVDQLNSTGKDFYQFKLCCIIMNISQQQLKYDCNIISIPVSNLKCTCSNFLCYYFNITNYEPTPLFSRPLVHLVGGILYFQCYILSNLSGNEHQWAQILCPCIMDREVQRRHV